MRVWTGLRTILVAAWIFSPFAWGQLPPEETVKSLQIAPVFSVLLILALMGYASNFAIRSLERRLCFWAQRATPAANSES